MGLPLRRAALVTLQKLDPTVLLTHAEAIIRVTDSWRGPHAMLAVLQQAAETVIADAVRGFV